MNKELSNIKLLVGLGNPGKEYEHTYHNAGRLFEDYLLKKVLLPNKTNEFKFRKPAAPKNFDYLKTERIIFARPFLFMNESGATVQAALKFFNVKPEELLVIHDDSDIEIGRYKISFDRGAGGHRGIESIIQTLKTKKFWRVRIGVRQKASSGPEPLRYGAGKRQATRKRAGLPAESRRAKAGEFVLKKITAADEKILITAFRDIEKKIMT